MSVKAKNLIIHLLNRNPSKRLGAGPTGADEIKKHPFFASIDWNCVEELRLEVPKPIFQKTHAYFKQKYQQFSCTPEDRKRVFEDA